jgi:hypothetical protein
MNSTSNPRRHVNRTLVPLKQSNMFVTCACVRVAAPGRIEYVLAGHPPMLHVRPRAHCIDCSGSATSSSRSA